MIMDTVYTILIIILISILLAREGNLNQDSDL